MCKKKRVFKIDQLVRHRGSHRRGVIVGVHGDGTYDVSLDLVCKTGNERLEIVANVPWQVLEVPAYDGAVRQHQEYEDDPKTGERRPRKKNPGCD